MRANLEVDHFCGFEGSLIFELQLAIRRFLSTKFPRYFDVIRPVSGPFPDCFLPILQSFVYWASIHLTRSKTNSFEGKITELW